MDIVIELSETPSNAASKNNVNGSEPEKEAEKWLPIDKKLLRFVTSELWVRYERPDTNRSVCAVIIGTGNGGAIRMHNPFTRYVWQVKPDDVQFYVKEADMPLVRREQQKDKLYQLYMEGRLTIAGARK